MEVESLEQEVHFTRRRGEKALHSTKTDLTRQLEFATQKHAEEKLELHERHSNLKSDMENQGDHHDEKIRSNKMLYLYSKKLLSRSGVSGYICVL